MPDSLNAAIAAGVQAPNPLAVMNQLTQTNSAVTQNALLQQQFAAKQAAGQAWQQSVDPNTGQVDPNKFNMLMAQSPAAAFGAGDALTQSQGLRNAQLAGGGQQLEQSIAVNKDMAQRLGGLLQNPNMSRDDVMNSAIDAMTSGPAAGNPAFRSNVLGELQSMPSDPQQLRQWVTSHALRNAAVSQQLEAAYGTPVTVNQGPNTSFSRVGMLPGQGVTKVGDVGMGLSPGEARELQTVNLPGGGAIQVPKGILPTGYDGSYKPFVPGGLPPGAIGGSPSPAQQAASIDTSKGNADQGIQLNQTAGQVPTRKATLANMVDTLNNFTPGPLSNQQTQGLSTLNQVLGTKFGADSVANQEEFKKLASQLQAAQGQALGGTDMARTLAGTINPHVDLSKGGAQKIIGILQAGEDAVAAKNKAWENYKAATGNQSGSNYNQFSNQFNANFDPRVFQQPYMSQADRQAMVDNLKKTPGAAEKFAQKYQWAKQSGLLNAGQ